MAERTKISALGNGSYLVKGLALVVGAEGNQSPLSGDHSPVPPPRGLDDEAVLRRRPFNR